MRHLPQPARRHRGNCATGTAAEPERAEPTDQHQNPQARRSEAKAAEAAQANAAEATPVSEEQTPMSPDTVLDALVIVLHARTEATRLRKVTSWTPAFEGASPEEPRLVHRLDQPGRYYYIVSFSMAAGTTARLRMNAYTGAYAEGIGIDKPGDVLPAYRTPPQSFQR